MTPLIPGAHMAFADNLKQLPPITHLSALQLLDGAGHVAATIENKPGQAGSLAVYAALADKHGGINVAAAQEALDIYAEHTADAKVHPGKHPNIDRLIKVIETGAGFTVKLIAA
ncbi:MAG: DUF2322 family protein [Chryseolinea sp.]